MLGAWALVIVDLQRYYLEPEADFVSYFESVHPGASHFIRQRCQQVVIPRLTQVVKATRRRGRPLIYLRLCGQAPDRSDLHRHFYESHQRALQAGFSDLYPLAHQPLAQVVQEVAPQAGDLVLDKTTYSAFTSSNLEAELRQRGLEHLVMAGLATSQCVDTTARDASDRGFGILHLEDCQADYHDLSHRAALIASRGVCGEQIYSGEEFLQLLAAEDSPT